MAAWLETMRMIMGALPGTGEERTKGLHDLLVLKRFQVIQTPGEAGTGRRCRHTAEDDEELEDH